MKVDEVAHRHQHISPRSVVTHHGIGSTITTMDRPRNPPRSSSSSSSSFVAETLRFNSNSTSTYDADKTLPPMNYINKSNPPKAIPFVSKLTIQQTLPLIFSAFWNGADLYEDVLGVDPTQKGTISSAKLRLLYFRKGREVLASPVEVDDEITTLTYQGLATSTVAINPSKLAIRSGVPISRKAKKRFQAICLAYEVLSDPLTRNEYDKWLRTQNNPGIQSGRKAFTHSSSTRLDSIIERISFMPTIKEIDKDSTSVRSASRSDTSFSCSDTYPRSSNRYDTSFDDPDLSRSFSTTSSGYDSILRPSTRLSRSKRSVTPTKIRWNEQVEKLVIMDYDVKNEHHVQPDDDHIIKQKGINKNKVAHSTRDYDDEDDVWKSGHPFFPEQDADSPHDHARQFSSSKKPASKLKTNKINGQHIERSDHHLASQSRGTDYDDPDELSEDDSERNGDDCGMPFAFDLAAGFQVALSKYLGNVLSDMKSGLSELGKTFSDMDVHNDMPVHDKQCGNEFFMDDYEVNALMSVLRTEMNQNPVHGKNE